MARQDKTWNVGHVCMCERGVYSSTGFTTSSCTKHVDRRLLGRHYQAPAESDLARGTLHSTKVGRGASPGHAVHGVNRNNNYPQSAHSITPKHDNTTGTRHVIIRATTLVATLQRKSIRVLTASW